MPLRLLELAEISDAASAKSALSDSVLCYCDFASINIDGAHVDSLLQNCSFTAVEWYWALFNCATLIECTFSQCTFRGVSFMGCTFVKCTFKDCHFLDDNLGGVCTMSHSELFACEVHGCVGWEEMATSQSHARGGA